MKGQEERMKNGREGAEGVREKDRRRREQRRQSRGGGHADGPRKVHLMWQASWEEGRATVARQSALCVPSSQRKVSCFSPSLPYRRTVFLVLRVDASHFVY